jgi:hypothetical protein
MRLCALSRWCEGCRNKGGNLSQILSIRGVLHRGSPRAAAAPQASAPSSVDLDAAADQAISTGGGDARKTMKGLIAANDFLALRLDELRAAVSKGYSRGRLPQVRELKGTL